MGGRQGRRVCAVHLSWPHTQGFSFSTSGALVSSIVYVVSIPPNDLSMQPSLEVALVGWRGLQEFADHEVLCHYCAGRA